MRSDTSDSLYRIRAENGCPISSTLLDIQRHRKLHTKTLEWFEQLECLYERTYTQSNTLSHHHQSSQYRTTAQLQTRYLGRANINPFAENYVAVSYTWDPAPGEDTKMGEYRIESRGKRPALPNKARNEVLNRVTKFIAYIDCRFFWIDKECIDQEDNQEKQIAIESMDLVYSHSIHPVALLSVRIDSRHKLNILAHLLSGHFVRDTREAPFLDLEYCKNGRAREALKLLNLITSDPWWMRAWTFQEDYRASTKMTLLIHYDRSLETDKRRIWNSGGTGVLFGDLDGELCVNSADFRRESSRFCLAYLNQSKCHAEDEIICQEILHRAPKYNVLLRDNAGNDNYSIQRSMSPIIFADVGAREAKYLSNRLDIVANCCGYSVRLDTEASQTSGSSLSISLLALYVLNGEILMNNDLGEQNTLLTDTIFDFLKRQSLNTFLSPVDEQLTFIKSCRFIHVKLSEEGVQTPGHLWSLGRRISVDLSRKVPYESESPNRLRWFHRRRLSQLLEGLMSGEYGGRYAELARCLQTYLDEDANSMGNDEPSFSKQFKDSMAVEVAEALSAEGKIMRLGRLIDGSVKEHSPYTGVFICDADEIEKEQFVFTASHPRKDSNDLDKHVSLEVDLQDYGSPGRPRLLVKRWVNGLYFFDGHPRRDVIFPWPRALCL